VPRISSQRQNKNRLVLEALDNLGTLTARTPKRQYKDLAVHWLQLAEQAEKTKSVERKQSE
jgi:hypothetical protein